MGRLTVKFQGRNLLGFDGTPESIAALKAEVEALGTTEFEVQQFVQAEMHYLISSKEPRAETLVCLLYRALLEPMPRSGVHLYGCVRDLLPDSGNFTVTIVPDTNRRDGYQLIVERSQIE